MQPENEQYRDFTEDDFLADPRFQDWVLAPSEAEDAFWQNLQLQFPDRSEKIKNARQLLNQLKFKEEFPSDGLVQEKYLDYQQHIKGINDVTTESSEHRFEKHRIIRWQAALKVAAVLMGLILISYIVLQFTNTGTTQSWSTNYGEQQSIYLPDSTLVVLNSKSQVRISKWKNDQPRDVWLEGEAFFDVRHVEIDESTKEKVPFTVHTKQVVIDVLGTAFDIRERRGLTEVVLQRGLINFKTVVANGREIMHPGDRIVYDPSAGSFNRSTVDVTDYLKWREKKLLLIDPTAAEICKYLEDNFGKRIVFEDSTLKNKKIEGPILINNLDDALFVISTVLNTKITQNDNTVILKSK